MGLGTVVKGDAVKEKVLTIIAQLAMANIGIGTNRPSKQNAVKNPFYAHRP